MSLFAWHNEDAHFVVHGEPAGQSDLTPELWMDDVRNAIGGPGKLGSPSASTRGMCVRVGLVLPCASDASNAGRQSSHSAAQLVSEYSSSTQTDMPVLAAETYGVVWHTA